MRLPYCALDAGRSSDEGEVAPAVPVSPIGLEGRTIPPTPAIVDSGADWTTYPGEFAAALGIHLKADCTVTRAHTAGGETTNYRYEAGLEVMIAGERHHLAANFCEQLGVPILGRKDFFALYRVTIDERNECIYLAPHDDPFGLDGA